MSSTFLAAIFLQITGTIGSGIFVLPYVFYHSNFIFAVFFLIFLGLVTGILNHFYCHIVAVTKGDHQLAGYTRLYLGRRFNLLASFNLILLALGAITAYLKLFSSFLSLLVPPFATIAPYLFLALLFTFYVLRFTNYKLRFSSLVSLFTFLIPISLFLYSVLFINHESYFINQYPNLLFYGATVFSLSGFTIIPEIDELLRRGRHRQHETVSLASFLGIFLVVVVYILFTFSVITLSGSSVSVNTVSGLLISHPLIAKTVAAFGLLVTFRASLNFLTILHELFFRDLKFSSLTSSFLALSFGLWALMISSIPLLTIISLTGGLTIFISALLVCLIRLRLDIKFFTLFGAILIMLTLFFGLIFEFL